MKNWDNYFYKITNIIAENSKCFSRKVGAILVLDKTIVGTGYNGPPRGVGTCLDRFQKNSYGINDNYLLEQFNNKNINLDNVSEICPRQLLGYTSSKGLEFCIAAHAERNTLVNSARLGIKTFGCILYLSCNIPCKDCLIEIINAGITEVVVTKMEYYDGESEYLVRVSKLNLRTYEF